MTTPTVYTSRSRTNRRRILLALGVAGLVVVGVVIGRLASGGPAAGSAPPPAPTTSGPAPSAAPATEPSTPSPGPTTAAQNGVDAYQPIQAEAADELKDVDTGDAEDQGGGEYVGWISRGDYVRFDGIDFGSAPAAKFYARVAADVGDDVNGRVLIRLDSADSPPIGTLPIRHTGGWQSWITQVTDVSAVTGTHTVYLTFDADTGSDFLSINYFAFALS